jgi:hypothetical protein
VAAAFLAVADQRKSLHSKWIPTTYWSHLVNRELKLEGEAALSAKKLRSILGKTHTYGRHFGQDDVDSPQNILYISAIERTLKTGFRSSDRIYFFCVRSRHNQDKQGDEILPDGKAATSKFFEERYQRYAVVPTIAMTKRTQTESLRVKTVTESVTTGEQPRVITPAPEDDSNSFAIGTSTIREGGSSQRKKKRRRRSTRLSLNVDALDDVNELLRSIINPVYLNKEDCLIVSMQEIKTKLLDHGERQFKKKQEDFHTVFDNGYGSRRNDLTNQVIDASKYVPCLQKYAIPFKLSALNDVISCAVELSKEVPEVLHVSNHSGKGVGRRLVSVTPSATAKSLYDNGKEWLPNFYEALKGPSALPLSRYQVCFLLIKLHRFHEVQAFEDVCRTKSTAAQSFKLDPHRQIAMFHTTNLTYAQGRGMRTYLNAGKCNPLQSERAIRKLEVNPDIVPIFSTFQEDQITRNVWCLPIHEAVESLMATHKERCSELHLILSADHGQGAFRANISAVFISSGRVAFEKNVEVAKIECRKDNRHVLVESGVAQKINSSLKKLKEESEALLTPLPIKLKATGDIAWYCLALGKESMAGHHCWRCKLRHSEFQADDFEKKGEPWTLQSMKTTLEKLECGELDRRDKSVERGLLHPPLIDCIEPKDWMCPVLHAVDLLVNTPFKYFKRWVWYRLENIPLDLMVARDNLVETEINKDLAWNQVMAAEEHYNFMELELLNILPPDDDVFEDKNHEDEYSQQLAIVENAEVSMKAAKTEHRAAEQAVRKAKKSVSDLEKKKEVGKASQDLWMSIERLLQKEYNTHPSNYHGGDMEGREARQLIRHIQPIMADIKSMLLQHLNGLSAEDGRQTCATPSEINLCCSGFERLFQYFDVISHYCYQPYGSMSITDVGHAKKTIRMAKALWRDLMPTIPMKIHAWEHLIEDLEQYRGMKSHQESQIERAHQNGVKQERRLCCVRDFKKKTQAIQRLAATSELPAVKAQVADTKSKMKKRKRRREEIDSTAEERLAYLAAVTALPRFEGRLPSLIDLMKSDVIAHRGVAPV